MVLDLAMTTRTRWSGLPRREQSLNEYGRGRRMQFIHNNQSYVMPLESERLDSYGIGEEMCKWKHVDAVVINGEWGERMSFCGQFHTCCFQNDLTSSQCTIFMAIDYSPVSLDSIRRSLRHWHDNIQWLALQKRSSLVLHILGGNAEMKNGNFSRSRVI